MFRFLQSWRRRRLLRRPFPASWEPIFEARLPRLAARGEPEREHLRSVLKVFVWEKHWIGAHDLQVTEEMKVMIAGVAAELGGGLALDAFDRLTEIVIYPSHYKHPGEPDSIVFGEVHTWGTLVLSWDAVKQGIANSTDGHNTALHEFAHVLDIADGAFDGTPILESDAAVHAWAKACADSFMKLQKRPRHHVVRQYGATNEAEFFACATEAFFEKPAQLSKKAPELYAVLQEFYRVDPVGRVDDDGDDVDETSPVEVPIDGVLDLHTFSPRDVKSVVNEYLDACCEKGLTEVRIIHGKGTGSLRRSVQAILSRRSDVAEFHLAPAGRGAWGATIVRLKAEAVSR